MYLSRLICVLLLLPLGLLSAGETRVMTPEKSTLRVDLQRAIELALLKNYQIEVDSYLPPIANEQLRSASGAFDPEFSASYDRSENTDRTVFNPNAPNSPTSNILQQTNFDAGIRGLLPWGMTYDAGVTSHVNSGTFNQFDEEFTATPQISLTQPILRDFGFSANLAQIRIARTDTEISEWQLRQTIINTVTQVVITYNTLNAANEALGVAVQFKELAERTLRDNIRRAEIGVMSPLDITTARAEVAAREEAVLVAQRAVRDNENFLKQLITDDIERILSTEIRIEPPETVFSYKADVRQGIEWALQLRPDYQQALLDIRRRGINLAFTKNQALPRLDLVGSLRFLGVDDDFRASFDRAIRRDQSEWTAGAVLSVPIPNRTRLANLNAVRLGKARALVDLKRLEQDIVVAVDNAAGQITTARERIISNREAVRLAYESLDAGEERLKAGTGTTFEVLELQKNLAEAEAAEIRAVSDYNSAIAEFERQTGTTLEHRNIVLK